MTPTKQVETDVIEVGQQFYIRANSSLADGRTLPLLHRDAFAVFDRYGDIQPVGQGQQGLFHEETRHLSRFEMRLGGLKPLLLSSAVGEDNLTLVVDLTNPEIKLPSGATIPQDTLHISRNKFLGDTTCFDQITVHNFGSNRVDIDLSFIYGADFVDIFEVRGQTRPRRGRRLPPELEHDGVLFTYEGLDHIIRNTRIRCSVAPNRIDPNFLSLELHLDSQQQIVFSIDIICDGNSAKTPAHVTFEEGLRHIQQEREASPLAQVDINTSNERFNDWLNRSRTDLDMLLAPTAFGHYPYAGIPWFSTIFGRDGLITAFELLWLAPEVAKGVLAYLAATQATSIDPVRDAEPGKILHETRKGEMARLGEVPFGQYYGSVDSTPLFVLLAAAYYERTADTEFLRNIWPNIHSAIDWIDRFGDSDGDGFVEYARKAESGLIQQGWKDSQDSVFHKDGSLAVAPIALCEVQAYVYAAKRGIATVARDLGHADLASNLESQAEEMRKRFSDAFWLDDLGMFALALDGNKRPCSVRSSNAGQCLFTGIANEAQTMRTLETLLDPCLFAGWGIRTIAATEKRYNPMSYHNGSIWPHDNALIAYGSCHLQRKEVALRVLTGLLDVALFVDLNRLPELICGFSRRPGKSPTLYPVACAPQAWAAGAVFMALQACLGLSIQAPQQRVHLYHTALPEALQRVEIRNLKIATAIIDLAFERYSGSVGVNILRRSGTVEIRSQK